MLQKTLAALVLVALALFQAPNSSLSAAPSNATFVTLYAHAHPEGEPGNLPILNALAQWGPQQAASLQEGEAIFSLDPPLGNNVTIDGTTTIRLWIKSDFRLTGNLAVYLTAMTPNGTSIFTHAVFNDTVFLDTRPRDFNYLVAINNLTLSVGSTILLHVTLSSHDKVTSVSLLYDNQATPTQITLSLLNVTNASIDLLTSTGLSTRIFETDPASNNATVGMRIKIVDALGLYRLKTASMKVFNSSGGASISYSNILPVTSAVSVYNATFTTSITLAADAYTLLLTTTDQSGYAYSLSNDFYVAPYFPADIRVIDTASRPIQGAYITISNPIANYTAETDSTGSTTLSAPYSRIVGSYQLTVLWRNLTLSQSVLFVPSGTVTIVVQAYDPTIRVRLSLFGFDLPGSPVELLAGSKPVTSGLTNSSGHVTFTQIPRGDYNVDVYYLGVYHRTVINVNQTRTFIIQVPIPHQDLVPYLVIILAAVVATGVLLRRRRFYRWPFEYLNVLTNEGIPDSRTTTIVGNSGSGKTVVMESLAYQSLKSGRGCVFVTNVELPSDVRATMKTMGMDTTQNESEGKLIFIDCYSSLSGTASKEKRSIGSITDLTSLGVLITRSIEEIAGTTDVYFDALTPLFTTLKPDYVLTFFQSIGAKVKSYNGGLCTIIGTSVEKETLTRVEEVSDCVIETQLSEGGTGQRRRLRIKKLRGHPYVDSWTRFVITDQGITFYTRKPVTT